MLNSEFTELIDRVRGGDAEAMQELFDGYADAIRREIRFSNLDNRVRRVVSDSDICQSVITNLFVGLWAGKYEFDAPQQLAALLKTMVRSRISDLRRHWMAQRRDMRRNTLLADEGAAQTRRGESPSQIVANAEILQQVKSLLSPRDLEILKLRQQRIGWDEIAKTVGENASADAVRKKYQRALAKISQELGLDE